MRGNERKNLTMRRKYLRTAMGFRIIIALLPALWIVFFFTLRLVKIDLPRTTDIIILASVMALCLILLAVESAYTKKHCKCPFCGRQWSMIKHKSLREHPFDLINNTKQYYCYNCREDIEII